MASVIGLISDTSDGGRKRILVSLDAEKLPLSNTSILIQILPADHCQSLKNQQKFILCYSATQSSDVRGWTIIGQFGRL